MPNPLIPCARPWRDIAEEACRENDPQKLATLFHELQLALAEPARFVEERGGTQEHASTSNADDAPTPAPNQPYTH